MLFRSTDALKTITNDVPMRFAGSRVLVLVPDAVSQNTIGAILEREGCEVVFCGDELDAVVELTRARIDLALIDVSMRRGNMGSIAGAFRERGFQGPLIAVASDTSEQHLLSCRAAGFSDVVSKQIKRGELNEVLRGVLRRRIGQRSLPLSED